MVGELSSLNMSRPELKAFDAQRAAINAEDAKRKVDLMPRIGLMGLGAFLEPGITLGPGSLSSLTVLGFNASWKISGLYKHANQKKLSQLALQKVDVQQTNFLFNKDLQTTQTRANIQKQQALLTEDGEIINLRNRIREGYQVKYDNGISSLIDLLNAAEKERESRIQMALHEMQLLMTYFEYKTQTGN